MNDSLDKASRMIPELPEYVATIGDGQALKRFLSGFGSRGWVTIDTEFLRERTYYPQLCLVQIADHERIALLDFLALDDTAPLCALLEDQTVCKIFHSASQDLEVIAHACGVMPTPVFDTQIAAALLGHDNQMGYARAVETFLGTTLPKAHTRTDWSRRPLPAGALDYAADDVRYLTALYQCLHQALVEADRLSWLQEDCHRLADSRRFVAHPETAWRRVKGWHQLPPDAQQVLAELAAWRERRAMDRDKPRRWILADASLLAMAGRQPRDDMALADTPDLPGKTLTRHGPELLACIERGLAHPACVLDPAAMPPDESTRRRIKTGMRALSQTAREWNVNQASLASRAEVAAIVAGKREGRLLQGWRAAAGQRVVKAVEQAREEAAAHHNS